MILAQPPSYLRGSIWSCPLIDTSFTHSCECYYLRIIFAWFYITWVNFPRSSIHSLLYTEAGDPLSLKEGAPTHLAPLKGQVHKTLWPEIILPPPLQMPYLASLNIPDLTKLTNDPILHDPTWPAMPTKLPLDIQKFKGKAGDDPANHVMTFHLWCSSNSIMDDSIRL
jgi:hypothetical protein